jgi:hypothetical protein
MTVYSDCGKFRWEGENFGADGLYLDPIPERLRDQARELFIAGESFLCLADNTAGLWLVQVNALWLLRRGIYEQTLLHAMSDTRTNHRRVSMEWFRNLFFIADKSKLLAAGDPLPSSGPFTLYRGVAGRGRARRVRGVSWTGNIENAIWYAKRFQGGDEPDPELADPAVFKVVVEAKHVMARLDASYRNEDEYLVLLPKETKVVRMEIALDSVAILPGCRVQFGQTMPENV